MFIFSLVLKIANYILVISENLIKRISEYQKGKVRATKERLPLILIYYETFTNQKDTKIREIFLKSGFGRSQLKKALQNRLKQLNCKYLQMVGSSRTH